MNSDKVSQVVEIICNSGCNNVNEIIQSLESGDPVDTVKDFSKTEIIELTNELKSIMSVYNKAD